MTAPQVANAVDATLKKKLQSCPCEQRYPQRLLRSIAQWCRRYLRSGGKIRVGEDRGPADQAGPLFRSHAARRVPLITLRLSKQVFWCGRMLCSIPSTFRARCRRCTSMQNAGTSGGVMPRRFPAHRDLTGRTIACRRSACARIWRSGARTLTLSSATSKGAGVWLLHSRCGRQSLESAY
jgi:hypothetical protein